MHFSQKTWIYILGALCVALFLLIQEYRALPDGRLHFYALDVGQGDALFMVTPSGRTILMDGGPDLAALTQLDRISPHLRRHIDLMILSHPHQDHLGALPDILERYAVDAALLSGIQYPNPTYREMLRLLKEKRVRVIIPNPSKDIVMGDGVILDVLWPPPRLWGKQGSEDDVNNTSVALRILYKDQSILLTGDMEMPEEDAVLATGADVSATILKAAHHGSRTSSSTGWLLASHPDVAVISAGKNNKFKHPNADVIARFIQFGMTPRITAEEGTIHLSW